MFAALLSTAFFQGLFGSAHCVGMCGPFVHIFNSTAGNRILANILYNTARLISYAAMGFFLGAAGWGIDSFFLSDSAAIIGSVLIIILALSYLFPSRIPLSLSARLPASVSKTVSGILRKTGNSPFFAPVLGLISGLLPCGLLYPAYSLSLMSGDPYSGAAVMAIFAVGTWPMLFLTGLASSVIWQKFRFKYYRYVLAFLMVALGFATLLYRSQLNIAGGEDCHTEQVLPVQ